MEKSLDRKLARILADPVLPRLHPRRRQGRRHGLRAGGAGPQPRAPRRRGPLPHARRVPPTDARDRRPGAGRHHADERQLQRGADDPRAAVRRSSRVTPAVRANDTTDIWLAGGSGRYGQQPSQPFRTATIDHIQCGKAECAPDERRLGADLGLYSVTFNNDVELDRRTLEGYKAFRMEAETKGFRHFLEVFDPNAARACRRPTWAGSSTTTSSARWPA